MTHLQHSAPAPDGTAADWKRFGLPHDCGRSRHDEARQRSGCGAVRQVLEQLFVEHKLPMSQFQGKKLSEILATLNERGITAAGAMPVPRAAADAAPALVAR